MASAQKKVILRQFDGELAWGYLPHTGFLHDSHLEVMQVDGKLIRFEFSNIKHISYVKDFNLDDRAEPERLGRRTFLSRPHGDGLWLRLLLRDGDAFEGLSSFDLSFLDSLAEDHGLFLTPPDARSNTQRIFLPRPAIASLEILGLVQSPARRLAGRKPVPTSSDTQGGLFGEPVGG